MASLAFVNPEAPYVSQGTFCYLPVRPYWYRLALSWIPRYVILIAIATMSLSIYLYVRHEFKSLDASSTTNSYSMPQGRARFARNGDSQSFQCDGMFSMTSSIPTMVGTATPNMSNRTAVEDSGPEQGGMGSQAPVWENYTFGSQAPAPMPTKAEIESEDMNAALQESRDRSMALNRANVSGDEAGAVVQALDETQPATPLDGNVSSNRLELVDSNDRPLVQARLKVRHKTIQRQLRYLFVYPIIYMLIWIVPFIQHCRLYSDTYSAKPSFALSLLSTIILALQCTVDSIVFTIREKPWRHIDYGDDTTPLTFKQSLKPRFKRHRRPPSTFSARSGGSGPSRRASYRPPQQSGTLSVLRLPSPVARSTAGMSRSERLAEARAARRRREVEVVAAKADRDAIRLERKKSMARRHGAGRSWWEVEGRQRKDSIMLGTNHSDLNMPRKRTLSRSSSNSLGAHLGPVDETPREGPRIFRSQTDHSEIAFETSPRGIIRISTEKEGNVFVGEEGASEASQSAGSSATRASGAKSTGYDGRA
jgi:G protein-coupled receptor GPR1